MKINFTIADAAATAPDYRTLRALIAVHAGPEIAPRPSPIIADADACRFSRAGVARLFGLDCGPLTRTAAPARSPTRPPNGSIIWEAGWGSGPVPRDPAELDRPTTNHGKDVLNLHGSKFGELGGVRTSQKPSDPAIGKSVQGAYA